MPSNLIALYSIVLMLANRDIQILLLRAGHYMQFLDQVLITINGTQIILSMVIWAAAIEDINQYVRSYIGQSAYEMV